MSKETQQKRTLSESHVNQINVLRALYQTQIEAIDGNTRHYHIHEIAQMSGLRDEKETQRYLFILEGQKLVSPSPEGDFTSRVWHITRQGMKAVKVITKTQ